MTDILIPGTVREATPGGINPTVKRVVESLAQSPWNSLSDVKPHITDTKTDDKTRLVTNDRMGEREDHYAQHCLNHRVYRCKDPSSIQSHPLINQGERSNNAQRPPLSPNRINTLRRWEASYPGRISSLSPGPLPPATVQHPVPHWQYVARWCTRWYTQGGTVGGCTPGYVPPYIHQGMYTRVASLPYPPRYVHQGSLLPYTLIYTPVTPWVYHRLLHPGVDTSVFGRNGHNEARSISILPEVWGQ